MLVLADIFDQQGNFSNSRDYGDKREQYLAFSGNYCRCMGRSDAMQKTNMFEPCDRTLCLEVLFQFFPHDVSVVIPCHACTTFK